MYPASLLPVSSPQINTRSLAGKQECLRPNFFAAHLETGGLFSALALGSDGCSNQEASHPFLSLFVHDRVHFLVITFLDKYRQLSNI